jgi:hypothetical protein
MGIECRVQEWARGILPPPFSPAWRHGTALLFTFRMQVRRVTAVPLWVGDQKLRGQDQTTQVKG